MGQTKYVRLLDLSFDGKEFKADQTEAQWLDYGFDWYGGVTFEDSKSTDPLEKRYALAWMNNWDYANNTPTMKNGFNGTDSVIRELPAEGAGWNIQPRLTAD